MPRVVAVGASSTSSLRRLSALLSVTVVSALAVAVGADAAIVTSQDDQGRTITFDVRAPAVDTEWYAAWLRRAAHGDEISTVTIRIVPEEQIAAFCGAGAAACYSGRRGGGVMTLPAGNSDRVAQYLLHEYAHHLDGFWPVRGVAELNGSQVWWNLRGIGALLAGGQVDFDYSRGWSRSIPEIFAEDYAWIHLPLSYAIRWLSPPDDALRAAMLQELTGTPPEAQPPAPMPSVEPLVVRRSGTLAARRTQAVPFGLLGPGRRVTLTATVGRASRNGTRARAEVLCNGKRVASRTFTRRVSTRTIDVPNLGPADCTARLVNATGVRLAYSLSLRLAIESR
jgi:hypothetical protein